MYQSLKNSMKVNKVQTLKPLFSYVSKDFTFMVEYKEGSIYMYIIIQ